MCRRDPLTHSAGAGAGVWDMESRTLKSLVHIVESVAARSFGSVFEVNDTTLTDDNLRLPLKSSLTYFTVCIPKNRHNRCRSLV